MTLQGTALPDGACDTHVHVFRRGAATVSPKSLAPVEADVAAFRAVRDGLGIARSVVVQPTAYGTDNGVTCEGILALGLDCTRGVAVVDDQVSDQTLQELSDGGIRGARLQMLPGGVIPWEQADRVAERAASAGWHVQLQLDGRTLPEREAQILAWSGPVVIDHIGKFLEPVMPDVPAFQCLLRLIDSGRVWVKLSAPYEVSKEGAPEYADVSRLAQALVQHAPERMLWASNWPHLGMSPQPNDQALLDLFARWAPDREIQRKILCDNPAEVYGF